jgi:hypothetical protein
VRQLKLGQLINAGAIIKKCWNIITVFLTSLPIYKSWEQRNKIIQNMSNLKINLFCFNSPIKVITMSLTNLQVRVKVFSGRVRNGKLGYSWLRKRNIFRVGSMKLRISMETYDLTLLSICILYRKANSFLDHYHLLTL